MKGKIWYKSKTLQVLGLTFLLNLVYLFQEPELSWEKAKVNICAAVVQVILAILRLVTNEPVSMTHSKEDACEDLES